MELLGSGFLARTLRPLASAHDGVLVLARGVSSTRDVPDSAYAREATAVYDAIHRCRDSGLTLVFFSTASLAMYQAGDSPGEEDGPVFPASAYGRHKLALESVVRLSGVRHLILRLAHVVGPDQPPHQLLPTLTRAVRSGRVLVHRGAYRDLIAAEALARIVNRLLATGVTGETVNVASGNPVTVERIVRHIEHRLGVTANRSWVDAPARCEVALARLLRLAPGEELGPDHYRTAVDSYLDSLTTRRTLT